MDAVAAKLATAPLPAPVDRVWQIPGSKSITNRAFVLAALADGTTRLEGVLESDDTRYMQEALAELGVGVRKLSATSVEIDGGRARLRSPAKPLFVGNSGTTVRFLTALSCLVDGPVTLVGDEAMAKRPIEDLVHGLRQLGVKIECATGCPPLTVYGGRLPGGRLSMRGDRSSQYFSALLLAGALSEGETELTIEGELVSRPYVEITRRMVEDFGGKIEVTDKGFWWKGGGRYAARRYDIEPDASSASYAFAFAAATGSRIRVPLLGPGALQGDYGFVDLLERAGAKVERSAEHTTVQGASTLRGIDADMFNISDTAMTLAALAPLAEGPTSIRNVANIRIKETDRLAATVTELRRLGQVVTEGPDFLSIEPRPLAAAVVRSYKDHRMAMSFAILGAAKEGVSIEDPACVAKTYPGFWRDLASAYPALPW
ncbi:MAG: 3-phosphoshikimate 1-carboxyvinyltransferase [Myxococcales bacterium]|nr:MAG: 3-phosphoshikimate 1-carboxyvinyltransferase [Myxococcales bacterium]